MKIGTSIQVILMFCLSDLNDCIAAITNGRDLWSVPQRWPQVTRYTKFHEDWYRHASNINVLPQQFERLLLLLMGGTYKVCHCNIKVLLKKFERL
jgi:hypothetical protein